MIGTINNLYGSWGSGLAAIQINNETVYADNGPLIRALQAMFGDVIEEGHTFNPQAVIGKKVRYETDGMMLTHLEPIEENTCQQQ